MENMKQKFIDIESIMEKLYICVIKVLERIKKIVEVMFKEIINS